MIAVTTIGVVATCAWIATTPPEQSRFKQVAQVSHAAKTAEPAGKLSDAERIARLKRTIETEKKLFDDLQEKLNNPLSDYHQADARFKELDDRLAGKTKELDKLTKLGSKDEAAKLEKELAQIRDKWQQAKQQFNLAIQERKMLQEKVDAMTGKIKRDQEALAQLTGQVQPGPKPTTDKTTDAASPATPAPATPAPPPTQPAAAAHPAPAPAATPVKALPTAMPTPGMPPAAPVPAPVAAVPEKPPTKELIAAQNEAKKKEKAVSDALKQVVTATDRIETLKKNIELEERLLQTAQGKIASYRKEKAQIESQLKIKLAQNTSEEELQAIYQHIEATEHRILLAATESEGIAGRIKELQTELQHLQDDKKQAVAVAKAKQEEAKAAEQKVADLKNPFTLPNIVNWAFDHGPELVLILLGMLLIHRLILVFSRRISRFMARSGGRGTMEERENRAESLVGVFRNCTNLVIIGGGVLMLFDEIGVPIVPLMGGAAVFGLAVAFGAQNLIRDYFSGFMVLMEDQYAIGDVVKIGETCGKVEKITLRMTVLRDVEGVVHFIPHGTICLVSNLTHGWSRALFDVGVAYKENPDQVIDVLNDLARSMRRDPVFGKLILDEPEMLGVDRFSDSAMIIRFFIKTKPLQQWPVKRELLRRIKHRFRELNIEIPYPHRVIHHHHSSDECPDGLVDMKRAAA